MDRLKLAITSAPCLIKISHEPGAGDIVLAVDASLEGWRGVLMQIVQGKRHPSRYESGLWNTAERSYDATKRECRAVLKAIRKVRYWLYGVHFILETDAQVLVAQLSRSATDLPGSLVTRWIAYIRLFDFEVRHVPGQKHTAADGLSRRPRTDSDDIDELYEDDIEDFIDAEINSYQVGLLTADNNSQSRSGSTTSYEAPLLREGYSEASWQIAEYLTTLVRPKEMSKAEFRKFKKKALCYTVSEGVLYRAAQKNIPIRVVVDSKEERAEVLKELHDRAGHRGVEATYHKIALRYFWDDCYQEVKSYVTSCQECQLRSTLRQEELLYPTWTSAM